MTIDQQVKAAVKLVSAMFAGTAQEADLVPANATVEELRAEVVALRRELRALRRIKRGVKPKVQDAVKVLLEEPDLVGLTVSMVAEIVRSVFNNYGMPCECKDSSVRWYISQYNLTWNICARRHVKLEIAVPAAEPEFDRQKGEER